MPGAEARSDARIPDNNMKAKLRQTCRGCTVARRVAGCLFNCNKDERVMRELDLALRDEASKTDPIMEQIKQCPEAFKAGELVGKLFESINYPHDETGGGDRYLPPAGTVVPPLV
jgi:hypothetical protein